VSKKSTPGLGKLVCIRLAAFGVLVACGGLAASCSSGSPHSSVASLGGANASQASGQARSDDGDQNELDFARCLRSHGVAEPDPFHRAGHAGLSIQIPASSPANRNALTACNHYLAPLIQKKEAGANQQLARWLPQLTHYAECMRRHDIGMLDPNTVGALNLGNIPGITDELGRYSPQFRSADSACRHLLPAAVHDDGTGP
jgi:hypothetical protein